MNMLSLQLKPGRKWITKTPLHIVILSYFMGLLSVSESNEQQIGKDSYRGVRQKQGILFSSIGNL
jgi:hypothetical protein